MEELTGRTSEAIAIVSPTYVGAQMAAADHRLDICGAANGADNETIYPT
jgi:hypothetical protein